MKTLKDLFELILKETEMNEGRAIAYQFSIDTHYQWCSMVEYCTVRDNVKPLFSHLSIDTPEKLQLAYWTIYNNGRSSN